MKKPKRPKKMNKSEFLRECLIGVVEKNEQILCWDHRRISYRVMRDSDGILWDVPVTNDLIKHDAKRWAELASRTWVKETFVSDKQA
jgi:hypothetical protein